MNQSAQGHDIEFKDSRLQRSIVPDLQDVIDQSIRLRMAVAFWTIDPDAVSSRLADLLSKEGSFACVDLHLPTNVDRICDLAQRGALMYFHGMKVGYDYKKPDGVTQGLSTNLLHSKVLLLDLPDGQAEVWVGSHNWTEYALGGFNIEASLRIKTDTDSALYMDIATHLEQIRRQCDIVDHSLREVYRAVQIVEEKVKAITLQTNSTMPLSKDSVVHIFGTDEQDYTAVSSVGKNIYVTVFDVDTKRETLYEANILKTGYLPLGNSDAKWTTLDEAYWALHSGTTPRLIAKEVPKESILVGVSKFWTTIVLKKDLTSGARLDLPADRIEYENFQQISKLDKLLQTTGWLHPDRERVPTIRRIPFEKMHSNSNEKIDREIALYDFSRENDLFLEAPADLKIFVERQAIEEHEKRRPLIQKLVLKKSEE
jgi:hypothetical protein